MTGLCRRAAAPGGGRPYDAVGRSRQGVRRCPCHVLAGVERVPRCARLSCPRHPCRCNLHSEPLRVGVTTLLETLPFFFDMVRSLLPRARLRDAEDSMNRDILAVAVAASVVALRLVDNPSILGRAGAPTTRPSPPRRRAARAVASTSRVDHQDGASRLSLPSSRPRRSTSTAPPASTLYCLPPVRILLRTMARRTPRKSVPHPLMRSPRTAAGFV